MLSHGLKVTTITVFTLALLGLFLSPFVFMVFTSLKSQAQISLINGPLWPGSPPDPVDYNGQKLDLYSVVVRHLYTDEAVDLEAREVSQPKKNRKKCPSLCNVLNLKGIV